MVFALGINALIGVNSRKTTWSVQGGFEVAAVCIYTVLYKCTLQGASHTSHLRQRSKWYGFSEPTYTASRFRIGIVILDASTGTWPLQNLLCVVVTHCYILVPCKPRNSRPRCDRGSNALGFVSPHIGILKLIFKYGSLNMDQSERRLEVHTSPSLNSGYLLKMRGLTHIKVYGGQVCALRWYLHWG